jgi:4-hydroxy-tetrahydrodipicolinate reductase
MEKVQIIVWGIGEVGKGLIRLSAAGDRTEVVGGICRPYPDPQDAAKSMAGKDLGELAALGEKLGVIASDDPDEILHDRKADIVFVATSSSYDEADKQILKAIESGANVISLSDPRLIYPWVHWPELARQIDGAAKKKGVSVLETGVSPGFIFDFIPAAFTGICATINKITTKETGDLSPFQHSFLDWLGLGIPPEEFRRRLAAGENRWAVFQTFPEIDLVAAAAGFVLDEILLEIQPVTSRKSKKSAFGLPMPPGVVCGIRQIFKGVKEGRAFIITERIWIVDPEAEGLEQGIQVSIEGEPGLQVSLKGEVLRKGYVAAYAHAFNAIPQVMDARPGLVSVKDLPPATPLR